MVAITVARVFVVVAVFYCGEVVVTVVVRHSSGSISCPDGGVAAAFAVAVVYLFQVHSKVCHFASEPVQGSTAYTWIIL